MKSEIRLGETISEDHYPSLKTVVNMGGRIVVLFTQKETGTVIFSERESQPVGYISKGWDERNFILFTGTVELSNN